MSEPKLKDILMGGRLEHKYVSDFGHLSKIVTQLKEGGYKIALTQGVFDMFHVGHKRYLEEAATHGDVLIVGVDSDELTKSMKGPNRPFDVFAERIEILSGLSSVGVITRRDVDQHKYDLIKLVSPDVLIMSKTTGSFNEEDKAQLGSYCGKIEHLEAKAATTTTAKMLRLMSEGAEGLARELEVKMQQTIAQYLQQNGVRK